MSKIIINSVVFSKDEKESLDGVKAILKDNKISYKNNGINVSIKLSDDGITLERESDDMKLILKFKENETLTTDYIIKSLDLKIKVCTKTKKIVINDNNFEIEYELFMNNEFSNSFTYKLEWSDL